MNLLSRLLNPFPRHSVTKRSATDYRVCDSDGRQCEPQSYSSRSAAEARVRELELDSTATTVVATPETLTFGANSVTSSATPLAKRRLLREPDINCHMCRETPGLCDNLTEERRAGRELSKQLCPCLWGGE